MKNKLKLKQYHTWLYLENGMSQMGHVGNIFSTYWYIIKFKFNFYVWKHIRKFLISILYLDRIYKEQRFRIKYKISRKRLKKLKSGKYGNVLKTLLDFDSY